MGAKLPKRGHPGSRVPRRSRLKELFGKGKILPRVRGIGPINRRDFLKLGGAGLAGATLLAGGGAGGGGEGRGGRRRAPLPRRACWSVAGAGRPGPTLLGVAGCGGEQVGSGGSGGGGG